MRISDWSSDVCSSDLHREWQGHLRGLNVLRVPVGQTPLNDLRDADICAFDIIAGEPMLAAQLEHGLDRGMNPRGGGIALNQAVAAVRSDERSFGNGCVRTCRARWSPCP